MTQAVSLGSSRQEEWRAVGPICAAHFLSHYYMIMLAPVFAFVRADFRVSYTDLALALTVFNVVSAALQTPAGFLVDRVGARRVLIAGVALGSVAFAVAGLVDLFAVFVVMYGVAGLGNTAYHPADYALLSNGPPSRIGQLFSFHTFAGVLGGAVAPATMLLMYSRVGWRGAYVGAALFGFAILGWLLAQRGPIERIAAGRHPDPADAAIAPGHLSWKFLLSPTILLNLIFFVLISLTGGLNTFLVVALGALYGTSTTVANSALTGLLLMNALGVLVGGMLASRTTRHGAVAALCLAMSALTTALIGLVDLSAVMLVAAASVAGLFVGIVSPVRDMLVRAATPRGAFGRVFGFVSSGFNIGSMIAPMVYGMFMDHGQPRTLFLFSAACSILSITTVVFSVSRRGRS